MDKTEQNIVIYQWRADQLFADAEGRGMQLISEISGSSAYIDGATYFRDLGISLIYSKNNKGPKIKPCGIPHEIFLGDEIWPLTIH